jgi:hypothetical protein
MTWCWANGTKDPAAPPEISSFYGPRPPILTDEGWTGAFHTGIDHSRTFSIIKSCGPGVVVYIGDKGDGYGLTVRIDHGSFIAWYCHLASRAQNIAVGDAVDGGVPLGVMGKTGKAKGVHLHLRFNHSNGQSFDPLPFLVAVLRQQQTETAGGGTTPIIETPEDDMDLMYRTNGASADGVIPSGFAFIHQVGQPVSMVSKSEWDTMSFWAAHGGPKLPPVAEWSGEDLRTLTKSVGFFEVTAASVAALAPRKTGRIIYESVTTADYPKVSDQ